MDIVPFETVISPATKLVVASLAVKVKEIDESFDVTPDETVELLITIVGTVVSTVKLVDDSLAAFPYTSLTLVVNEYEDPLLRAAKALAGIVIEVELLDTVPV